MKIPLFMVIMLMLLSEGVPAAEVALTEKDGPHLVRLQPGDLLSVSLPSNPTTGYSWSVCLSKQGILVRDEALSYRKHYERHSLVGAGGMESWKFKALQLGKTKLTFSYARPWEKGVPAARTLCWPILIKP